MGFAPIVLPGGTAEVRHGKTGVWVKLCDVSAENANKLVTTIKGVTGVKGAKRDGLNIDIELKDPETSKQVADMINDALFKAAIKMRAPIATTVSATVPGPRRPNKYVHRGGRRRGRLG